MLWKSNHWSNHLPWPLLRPAMHPFLGAVSSAVSFLWPLSPPQVKSISVPLSLLWTTHACLLEYVPQESTAACDTSASTSFPELRSPCGLATDHRLLFPGFLYPLLSQNKHPGPSEQPLGFQILLYNSPQHSPYLLEGSHPFGHSIFISLNVSFLWPNADSRARQLATSLCIYTIFSCQKTLSGNGLKFMSYVLY